MVADGPSVVLPLPDGSTPTPSASTCPKCLAELIAPCTPAGSCVQQIVNFSSNVCYGNGVKLFTAIPLGPILTPTPPPTMARVIRPDGATCYLRERSSGNGGPIFYSYQSPDRKDVGSVILPPQGPGQAQIRCAGEALQPADDNCLTQLGIGIDRMCTDGTCM